ncbi:type II secretion system ATPase GspE [Usitatibacter palustris]|uniref:Type II secretion system protein E n=1 Tax=Usitatibacter palustris TaxID=2732487 RepID=A0A6M4HA74_9PROT|nr:type II secretion system ATPase GspE [Usitatibacter palustris]QJR15758.1 putative type II secretion system protein HxcR [Usitatibacter palustris]
MTAPLERTVNPQELDPTTVRLLPYPFAKAKGVIAARVTNGALEVWVRPYPQGSTLSEVRRMAGKPLKEVLLTPEEFEHCLTLAYTREPGAAETIVEDMGENVDLAKLTEQLPEVADLLEAENDAPIIRLINALLTQAMREGASDIHLEIFESRALVRFRVDGALRDVVEPRRGLHPAMVSRIKVMASLDIAEKRLPQDGRITLRIAGRPVDVRVSTIPTANGERVVLRLLDKQSGRLTLDALGMDAAARAEIDALIEQPHGIVLVTGPTGSGKTTTLYAALSRLDRKTRNIMTVEDPVEYELDGVGQTQVNPRIEMTFARALRAILRQDPDVVMIGEIRDLETAQIAVQASLTGHLVLATLHTNDAPGAVTRLIDMGIEPYLLASTLNGVLAQRLVRKLCPACKTPSPSPLGEGRGEGDERTYAPVGCAACNFSGYKGRTGIYELLTVDDDLRRLIHDTAAERELRDHAVKQGLTRLRDDGMRWVREGATSLDEVLRVTRV